MRGSSAARLANRNGYTLADVVTILIIAACEDNLTVRPRLLALPACHCRAGSS